MKATWRPSREMSTPLTSSVTKTSLFWRWIEKRSVSGAACSWDYHHVGAPPYPRPDSYYDNDNDGVISWGEVKWKQMEYGDSTIPNHDTEAGYHSLLLKGYPKSCFPVLRCFWHASDPDSDKKKDVINQSFESRQFWSGALWETTYRN